VPASAGADIQHFYDEPTGSLSYVVSDPDTKFAAVIDPVLGFSAVSGRTDKSGVQKIIEHIKSEDLSLEWILETHAHADHLTAAQFLKAETGGQVGIGQGICKVQEYFAKVFNLQAPFRPDGHQFDRLFSDGESIEIGNLECRVLHTPGHTNDSVTYIVEDAAFVGDSLFMCDYGTARCDFPGGDPGLLFDSIQKLYALGDDIRLFMCHDYPPEDRDLRFQCTVAEQKQSNVHVSSGTSRDAYIAMRESRDATLGLPNLILPSIQVNIRAGHLPDPEDNQVSYIKIPLDTI
jgi:glyoxylase-like metal-dependent hydrolase (beta-lactamase superfamily II)